MARKTDIGENSINRIVEGTTFEGNIHSDSNIRIDGFFNGDLTTSGRLVVGSSGSLRGNVACADCEVEGTVDGHLHAKGRVSLKSTARVEGEVFYGQLAIESGAELSGTCYINTKVKEISSSHLDSKSLEEKTA
tara:strand:+ start:55 stop:456 length:402 start_codon:yes stop_codon:yes gene_type:complete